MLWSGALRETRDEERQHIPKLNRWTPHMVQVESCNIRTYKPRRPQKVLDLMSRLQGHS